MPVNPVSTPGYKDAAVGTFEKCRLNRIGKPRFLVGIGAYGKPVDQQLVTGVDVNRVCGVGNIGKIDECAVAEKA